MWKHSITRLPTVLRHFYCNTKTVEINNLNALDSDQQKSLIDYKELKYETKVPLKPIENNLEDTAGKVEIDSKTIQLLERLSLVDLDSKEALKTLEDSIQFANKIINIDTHNIKPLYTVLENEQLYLRDDKITEGNCKDEILNNAKVTVEDYFVAPPGNIPLEQEEKNFLNNKKPHFIKE